MPTIGDFTIASSSDSAALPSAATGPGAGTKAGPAVGASAAAGCTDARGSTATLPLLRGGVPTHLILCARAGQTHLETQPVPIPPLGQLIRLYEDLAEACGTFPRPETIGVALNTFHIPDDAEALAACQAIEAELGLPCVDPVRHGAERLAN